VEQTVFHWVAQYGYPVIILLLMLGIVGIPIPDETLLTFVGFLVYKGDLYWIPALLATFFGSTFGITLSYCLGHAGGMALVKKYGHIIHITPDRIIRVHHWLDHKGKWSLTFGYFVPGVRHLTALVAGTTKLRFPVFAVFAYAGAFMWSGTFLTVGYLFGKEWVRASEKIHHTLLIICGIIGAVLLAYYLFSGLKHKHE